MASMITEKTVKTIIGRRKREIHKGDCGRILIAAGSWGMAGAAILAARSALRAGSGLVRTAIPKSLFPIVQVGVPEATCIERKLPIQNLADFDAICVGPGMGEEKESIDFVKELLISYEKTLLIDADGLNIIAHNDFFALLRRRAELYPERTILTPHMGEARRLLAPTGTPLATRTDAASLAPGAESASQQHGSSVAEPASSQSDASVAKPASRQHGSPVTESASSQFDAPGAESVASQADGAFDFSSRASSGARERIAEALVQKTQAIIVLKGAGTLVAAPGRQTYTNITGNPGMATAGSGDVLSGIITGIAGQRKQIGEDLAPACGAESQAWNKNLVPDYEPEPETSGKTRPPVRIGAFEAALAGVYIHGLAGDLAAEELGEYGVTAGDIALYTAYAMKKILSEG